MSQTLTKLMGTELKIRGWGETLTCKNKVLCNLEKNCYLILNVYTLRIFIVSQWYVWELLPGAMGVFEMCKGPGALPRSSPCVFMFLYRSSGEKTFWWLSKSLRTIILENFHSQLFLAKTNKKVYNLSDNLLGLFKPHQNFGQLSIEDVLTD